MHDEDKEDLGQEEVRHVSKVVWTQMEVLVTHLALHRQESPPEGEDEDKEELNQEEIRREHDHSDSDDDLSSTSSDSSGSYCCPICGLPTRILWVACDSCDRWFHAECTDIHPDNFCNLKNVDWVCNDCV